MARCSNPVREKEGHPARPVFIIRKMNIPLAISIHLLKILFS